MRVSAWTFSLQKAGNDPDDYEDASCVSDSSREHVRVAIADGATESSFAGEWARILVEAFGQRKLGTLLKENRLAELGENWRAGICSRSLPWYAEEKLQSGAFSAFLGLAVSGYPADQLRWTAVAVGDSCLFHVRDDQLLRAFPLSRSDQFDNHPYLLSSLRRNRRNLRCHTRHARGSAHSGDLFLLATDAFAAWFLKAFECGRSPWDELAIFGGHRASFEGRVRTGREQGWIRNDDVTLVSVRVS